MGPPRVTRVLVDWMRGYGNSPRLTVEFDREAAWGEFAFEEREGLYLATLGEAARYLYHDGRGPGQGFGGRRFDLRMVDGSTRRLVGPWSSSSGDAGRLFPERRVTEGPGSATAEGAARWVRENRWCGFGLALVRPSWAGEGYLLVEPTLDGRPKDLRDEVVEALA